MTLGSPIAPYSSRTWTFQATAGSVFLVSATAGMLQIFGPTGGYGPVGQVAARNLGDGISEAGPGDFKLVSVPQSGVYSIVLRAWSQPIFSTEQLLVSVASSSIEANTLTPLESSLPAGLGRAWTFIGTVGEPVALGVEGYYSRILVLRSPSGLLRYCEPSCIVDESGLHTAAVINDSRFHLPDTLSIPQGDDPLAEPDDIAVESHSSPWPAGTRIELSTPTFTIGTDTPLAVTPIPYGLVRIGSFEMPDTEMRACFTTDELYCILGADGAYDFFDGGWETSGTNWVIVRPRFSSASTSQYVEIVSPAGSTTLNTYNSVPGGHIGAFWSLNGTGGEVLTMYSPSHPTWFRGLPGQIYGSSAGVGSTIVLPIDGTYYVGISARQVAGPGVGPQVVVTADAIDLEIDVPTPFSGDIHDWQRSLWRFEGVAGQVLYSSQMEYVFRVGRNPDSSFRMEGVEGCPCSVPAPGTYYAVPKRYLAAPSSSPIPPPLVQMVTVRPVSINQVYTLPATVAGNTELILSFYLPSSGIVELIGSGGSWESATVFGAVENSYYECASFPCWAPNYGRYVLSVKAGPSGFPAGMQILVLANFLPISR